MVLFYLLKQKIYKFIFIVCFTVDCPLPCYVFTGYFPAECRELHKKNFLLLFLCSNQYRAGRVYGLYVYYMTGAPEGSTESGTGKAGIRSCDPCFTSHSTYPLHHGSTVPRGTVGNVSGNRYQSDCRSRGREFDPGPVPYFRKIISTVILLPSAESFKKECCQLQAKVCARSTGTACSSLPRKKCGYVNWPSRHDHSC